MTEPRRQLVFETLPATDPQVGRALWAIEDARTRTKTSLAGLDSAMMDVIPDGFENSIGSLLYHIAVIEADWMYAEVREEEIPDDVLSRFSEGVRDTSGMLVAPAGRSLEEQLHVLDLVRARLVETFGSMSLDEYRRARRLPQYDVTPEWVLHHLMQHEAEHRGHIETLRHIIETGPRADASAVTD